jgi:hypothetical protein
MRDTSTAAERTYFELLKAQDTILRKLLWYRDGGCVSEKQWRDLVAVLRINADSLDEAYLTRWSQSLGAAELLVTARRAAEAR